MSTLIEVTSVTPKTVSVIAKNQPLTISWTIGPNQTTNPSYIPTQASAKIGWCTSQEEEYQYTEIIGATQEITYPANTFAGTGSVYFSLEVYDVSGTWNYKLFSYYPRLLLELAMTGGAGVDEYYPDQTFAWNSTIYERSVRPLGYFDKCSLFMFEAPATAYKYKAIFNAGVYSRVYPSNNGSGSAIGGDIKMLSDVFDQNTVTWNSIPIVSDAAAHWSMAADGSLYGTLQQIPACIWGTTPAANSKSAAAIAVAKALMVTGPLNSSSNSRYISLGGTPVLRLWFIDQTVTSKPQAAKYDSGYVNRHVAQIFEWDLVPDSDYSCFGSWAQVSAIFSCRTGPSDTWTNYSISGSTQSITFPANTLPAGTVQWKIQTTDDQGTTATSDIYTITTTDSTTTATPIVPKETVENGDAPIRFSWEVDNDHDTAPTRADLQYSTDGSTWTTFAQIQTSATQYDAPGGTFSSGMRYWRVRAYNADGVAGTWSDPVTFVVVAAPPAPVVSADGKPYATVSWQSSGQMAYRVTVDNRSFGPYFGTAKSFEVPDFLTDGSHTATVSVQGEAGLWSQPGSVTFSVTNVPGQPVSLTGKFGRDAALKWTTDATVDNFYIYRDNVRIGHTAVKQFTDRYVLGHHEYSVINKLPGGYYTRSNIASGTMRSCTRVVAAFDGGSWLEMALSDESDTTEEFSWNQVVSERYVTGSDLPVVETSPYRSSSGSYRISFKDVETGAAFEALRGRKVIVKSRGGNVAIGVLSGYTKIMGNFYINYIFSVRSCSWEDYVDETGD